MGSPRWILGLVAAALVVLVAAALLFTEGGRGTGEPVEVVETEEAPQPTVEEEALLAREVAAARTAIEAAAVEPRAPVARESEFPAAYRRWLGRAKGRVVEADGAPVPGFPVEALVADVLGLFPTVASWFEKGSAYAPRILDAKAMTDEEGRFVLEDLDSRMPHALVLGNGTARATIRFLDHNPGPGETVDLGDIALAPFATLFGRVRDEKGGPVAGARVRASDLPAIVFAVDVGDLRAGSAICGDGQVFPLPRWIDPWLDDLPVPTVRTGADGTFRMEGAPVGSVTLLVDKEGFPSLVHGPVSTKAGGEQKIPDLVLEEGEVLEGKVVDTSDKPVEGAELLVGSRAPVGDFAILRPGGVSGAKGEFRIPALRAKPTLVAARRGPREPWVVAGPVDPGFEEAVVKLRARFDLFLDVADESGAPIEEGVEALVRRKEPWSEVSLFSPFHPLEVQPESATPGRFRARDLLEGEYEFLVRVEGFAAQKASVVVKGPDTIVGVRLPPGLGLRVRVVLVESESPVEFAFVAAVPGTGGEIFKGPQVAARTDVSGGAFLEGLAAGDWTIQVYHPAYALVQENVRLPREEPLVVALQPGGSIEGTITRGGLPPGESHMVVAAPRREFEIPRFTSSDEEGRFALGHLAPGRYEVHALDRLLGRSSFVDYIRLFEGGEPEKADAEVRAGETTQVTIDLQGEASADAGSIVGTVILNGLPSEGAVVRAHGRRGRSARTDAGGAFRLGGIPAGEVRVSLSIPAAGDLPIPQQLASRTVKLAAGSVETIDFVLETGRIRGQVVSGANGSAIPFAQVSSEPVSDGGGDRGWGGTFAMADAQGRFVLEPVPATAHRVRARAEGFSPGRSEEVRVPYGGEPGEVVLRLFSAVRVRGRVVLPPAPEESRGGASLQFRSKDDEGQRAWAPVDRQDGSFDSNNLSPGTYEVQVHVWGPDTQEFEPLELVVPPAGLDGVVLQPLPK
jgi:hypothetical protein